MLYNMHYNSFLLHNKKQSKNICVNYDNKKKHYNNRFQVFYFTGCLSISICFFSPSNMYNQIELDLKQLYTYSTYFF